MQIEKDVLLKYYTEMKRIRLVECAIADNYFNDVREMHTPIHLYDGQEAVAVGVCQQLESEDVIFSNHRCHGHYLAKGGNLRKMIAELFTKETGCCKGKGGSMHLADKSAGVALSSAIVAGNVSVGTGYALGFKQQESHNIAVVFLGDGATEEGNVYESICFAKLHALPVLYVCENNLYAVSTAYDVREPLHRVSDKFKTIIETHIIDGNDIFEVANISSDCIKRIRNGEGPVFLECMTYRFRDHHSIKTGIESGYRTLEEWQDWNAKCPIKALENYLISKNWIDTEKIISIEEELQNEILDAFHFAHESSLPRPESLFENVWR